MSQRQQSKGGHHHLVGAERRLGADLNHVRSRLPGTVVPTRSVASSGRQATFTISYHDGEGPQLNRRLEDVTHVPFQLVGPIRTFPAHRRQRHLPGYYWFAKTRRLIPYESRLEMAWLVLLDYDLQVEAVSSQPFCLHTTLPDGKRFDHVPDFFAILKSGRGRVVDVTRAERRDVPRRRASSQHTARACRVAGWEYSVETEPDPMLLTNVSALAGFRREPVGRSFYEDAIIERCATPTTIGALSADVGTAATVRPILFHLLWKQHLTADLTGQLTDATLVTTSTKLLAAA